MKEAQAQHTPGPIHTREWGNLILETRLETGSAARCNRGRYSGAKTHLVMAEYIVGRIDTSLPLHPASGESRFAKSGKPTLFSARPACGCTQGQHAALPDSSPREVTCTNCAAIKAARGEQ